MNRRKNRTDVPGSYHPATWDAINTLDYAKGAPKSRIDWTPAQLATIAPVEGAAINVEAFLYKVKVESSSVNAKSGGESTATPDLPTTWTGTCLLPPMLEREGTWPLSLRPHLGFEDSIRIGRRLN